MYCQNFGVTNEGNRFAASVVRLTKIESRGLPASGSSPGEGQSVFVPRLIPVATPMVTVEVKPLTQAAVTARPTATSNETQKKARIVVLKETSMAAAMFCVVTAVGIMVFVPTTIEVRLLGSAIWLGIAFGIFMMSRVATIVGLALLAINIVVTVALIVNFPHPAELDFKAAYLVGFFYFWWTKALYAAMFGSFEYHRSV